MHILDIIFGILLLVLAFKCMLKGFMASFIELIGLVVIVFAIAKAGQFVKLIVIEQLGWGDTVATVASYILIAVIILIMIRLIIFLINRMVEFLRLKWLNKLLGAVFGILNGLLLIAILIIITDVAPFNEQIREFSDKSFIIRKVRVITDEIETKYPQVGKFKKPIKEKIDKEIDKGADKLEDKAKEAL